MQQNEKLYIARKLGLTAVIQHERQEELMKFKARKLEEQIKLLQNFGFQILNYSDIIGEKHIKSTEPLAATFSSPCDVPLLALQKADALNEKLPKGLKLRSFWKVTVYLDTENKPEFSSWLRFIFPLFLYKTTPTNRRIGALLVGVLRDGVQAIVIDQWEEPS